MRSLILEEGVDRLIYLIRGQKVMLDRDLARLYGVPTKVFNQAVKRHRNRFPGDFMFQLDALEIQNWKSQFVTSNLSIKMGLRKAPYAFTEQGVAMLSSVLNSERAVQVNIAIMRAFVKLREVLGTHKELAKKLETIERQMGEHGAKFGEHAHQIRTIFEAIGQLMQPAHKFKRKIGFVGSKNPS